MTLRSQAGRRVSLIGADQPPARSSNYIRETLGPDGHLARALPGYESRPGQIRMAEKIDEAIRDGRHLFAEAPCGVGKGIGYLVPSIHHALARQKKVIVVTANINLQEQLATKDLPLLRRTLPTPFSFAIAKGRSNYLCPEALADNYGACRDPRWADVLEWADRTATGDVSELPFEPGAMRRYFTVSADDCLRRACPSYEQCPAEAAKKAYWQADVIVTNYHLFLLDMMIRQDPESEGILPLWDVAVFDEAHHLPDIARDLLGWRVTRGTCEQIAAGLGSSRESIDPDLAGDIRSEATEVFDYLLAYAKGEEFFGQSYKVRFRKSGEAAIGGVLPSLLERAAATFEAEAEDAEPKRRARMRNLAARAHAAVGRLNAVKELFEPDKHAYFIDVERDENGRGRAALACKLIWPKDVLRARLFTPPGRTCVLTSATLAVDGSFDFAAIECGAEKAREIVVPSPFDFERNALLVIPRGMPDPRERDEHEQWAAEQFVEVARAARGRTLGLFTSYRGLKKAEALIGADQRRTWGSVLVQGEAPRGQLVQRFKAEVGSVLLGVDSFWEGVDVPGEALSAVVIDRLPFATPDDPVLDAVDALLPRGAFSEWSLPRAVTSIRQGFGRLIRSATDRGVVVLLDDRVLTKKYGGAFLRSLPPAPLSRRLEDVAAFLGTGKIQG